MSGSFHGPELLKPGVISCSRWRVAASGEEPDEVAMFGGVGRKR
ncbi:hypothetical protein ACSNOK_09980 [Streptomyces sp. URMC 126]